MMFIVRWPVALVLLGLALLSLTAAAATGAVLVNAPIDLSAYVTPDQMATLQSATWLETGLWAGAGLFFLISTIRLLRRTQAFWTWLIGFALYGGRWAVAQQSEGGLQATAQSLTANSFQPEALTATPEAPAAQVAVLAAILIVGLIVFLIDAADRSYWDRQGA
jgi:hypothetical protein